MPTPNTQHPTRSTLWYPQSLRLTGPKLSRRQGASAIVNGLNAADYWMHGDDPTYLIGCMRTQIANLWELALHSDLSQAPNDDQKTAVVTLLRECRDALYGFDPLTPQAQSSSGVATSPLAPSVPTQTANGAFSRPVAFAPTGSTRPGRFRTASTQSQIESNAKAALGAIAYLNDPNLFGQRGQALYAFIQYRLQQAVALMEGSVSLGDVVAERQRLLAQQQQEGAQTVQPQQMPYQAVTPIAPTAPSASGAVQTPAPSPVAGLESAPRPETSRMGQLHPASTTRR